MEAAFDVLPDIADFGAVGPAEIGVGKVFRHVVLLVHPEGVVLDDGLLNLAPVIGVRAKPGEIADIVAEHYVVGDETAVREGGGHSSGSGEQVGHDLNVLALPPGHLGDEGQQLIFVAQITAVVDKGGFVWRGLCCHSLPPLVSLGFSSVIPQMLSHKWDKSAGISFFIITSDLRPRQLGRGNRASLVLS